MTDRLSELEAIARAATQGEWFPVHGVILIDAPGRGETDFPAVASCVGDDNEDANAAHIAAFDPPTVLKLLAVARAASKIDASLLNQMGAPAPFGEMRAALAALRADQA